MKLLGRIYAILKRVINLGAWLAAMATLAVSILIAIEVLGTRWFFGPRIWLVEVTSWSLVFITFLSTAWVLKRGHHVRMDLLVSRFKPKTQLMVNAITSVFGAFLCGMLTWFGILTCWQSFLEGEEALHSLRLPTYTLYFIIPLGFFLLFIEFIARTGRYVREWREPIKKDSGRYVHE